MDKISRQRPLFFSIGLMFSCLLVITAFEWKVYQVSEIDLAMWEEGDFCGDGIFFPVKIIEVPKVKEAKKFEFEEFEEDGWLTKTWWHHSSPPPVPPQPVVADIPDDDIEIPRPICDLIEAEGIPPLVIEEEDEVLSYDSFEEPAHPVGGFKAFYKLINQNLHYPALAQHLGIEGKVFVQFTVEKDGSLTNFKIIKGVHSMLDQEALQVLKMVPKWIPNKYFGKVKKVTRSLPIVFKLQR